VKKDGPRNDHDFRPGHALRGRDIINPDCHGCDRDAKVTIGNGSRRCWL